MKLFFKALTISAAVVALQHVAIADSAPNSDIDSAEHLKKVYIGLEGGISIPLKKTFKEKVPGLPNLKYKGELSQSGMYGAILGYGFYPGMAAEFNFQRKPNYKLKVTTPAVTIAVPRLGNITIPSGSATTKIKSE